MKAFYELLRTVRVDWFKHSSIICSVYTDRFGLDFYDDVATLHCHFTNKNKYKGHGYTCSQLNRRVLSRAMEAIASGDGGSVDKNGARL